MLLLIRPSRPLSWYVTGSAKAKATATATVFALWIRGKGGDPPRANEAVAIGYARLAIDNKQLATYSAVYEDLTPSKASPHPSGLGDASEWTISVTVAAVLMAG